MPWNPNAGYQYGGAIPTALQMTGLGNMMPEYSAGMGMMPNNMGGYPGMGGGGYDWNSMFNGGGFPGMGGNPMPPFGGGSDIDALLGYGENKDIFSIAELQVVLKPVIGGDESDFNDYRDKIESTITELEEKIEKGMIDYQAYLKADDQLTRLKNRLTVMDKILDTDGALDILLGDDGKFNYKDLERVAKIDKGDTESGDEKTIDFSTDLNQDYDRPPVYEDGNYNIAEMVSHLGINVSVDDTFNIYDDAQVSSLITSAGPGASWTLEEMEDLYRSEQITMNLMQKESEDYTVAELAEQARKVDFLKFISTESNFKIIAAANHSAEDLAIAGAAGSQTFDGIEARVSLKDILHVMTAGDTDIKNMAGLTSGDIKAFTKEEIYKDPAEDNRYKRDVVLKKIFGDAANITNSDNAVASTGNKFDKQGLITKLKDLYALLDGATSQDEYTTLFESIYVLTAMIENFDTIKAASPNTADDDTKIEWKDLTAWLTTSEIKIPT